MHAKTGHHCVTDAADIGTEAVWPPNWCLTAVRTAWLLLLSQWGSLTIVCCIYGRSKNFVRGAATAWVKLLPAWDSLCAVCCLVCVPDAAAAVGAGRGGSVAWLMLLTHCCCSSVPHAAAALVTLLCSQIQLNFRVRGFDVDLSWRIDRQCYLLELLTHSICWPIWWSYVKAFASSFRQNRQTNRQTDKPTNEHTCQKILASNDWMHLSSKWLINTEHASIQIIDPEHVLIWSNTVV